MVCEEIGLSTTPSQTWRDPRMTSAGQPSSRMRNLIGDGNRLWASCVLRTRKLQCNGVQPCHRVSRWSPAMTSLEIDQPRVVTLQHGCPPQSQGCRSIAIPNLNKFWQGLAQLAWPLEFVLVGLVKSNWLAVLQ